MRRANGSGALYYVESQGLWRAAIDLEPVDGKRRQWVATSRDREKAEAKLHAKLEELGRPRVAPDAHRPGTRRQELLRAARARGEGHTRRELRDLFRNKPEKCRYCDVRLSHLNASVDHIVPVSLGGTDAISNLQIICWECNLDKSDLDEEFFAVDFVKPRPFRVLPRWRGRDGYDRQGYPIPARKSRSYDWE